jgi:hypothetical protein
MLSGSIFPNGCGMADTVFKAEALVPIWVEKSGIAALDKKAQRPVLIEMESLGKVMRGQMLKLTATGATILPNDLILIWNSVNVKISFRSPGSKIGQGASCKITRKPANQIQLPLPGFGLFRQQSWYPLPPFGRKILILLRLRVVIRRKIVKIKELSATSSRIRS